MVWLVVWVNVGRGVRGLGSFSGPGCRQESGDAIRSE